MGFYIRKTISAGPFNFNLSKSGVGISGGIRGLSLGIGPRGNYVHMGRGGVFFRKTLSAAGDRARTKSKSQHQLSHLQHREAFPVEQRTVGEFTEIDSGNISQMTSSSSAELLREINEKREKMSWFPIAAILSLIVAIYILASGFHGGVVAAVVVLLALGLLLMRWKDQLRKCVVLIYDFDTENETLFDNVHEIFKEISACARIQHIEATAEILDAKYHSGADSAIKPNNIKLKIDGIPFLKTNILIPQIPVGKQTLAFLPDWLLVFEPKRVGAVEYRDLEVKIESAHVVEHDGVPSDSRVVGRTWRYVNKKGGPDRRFKDNIEIPIVEYDSALFTSTTGLNELIYVSKVGVLERLKNIIREIGQQLIYTENESGVPKERVGTELPTR